MLGSKIRFLRKKQKLTLQELSDKAKISLSYLSDIEKGRSNPSVDTLIGIAKALETKTGYFLDEEINNVVDLIDIIESHNESCLVAGGQPLTNDQRLGILRVIENPDGVKKETPIIGDIKSGVDFLAQENYKGYLEIPADMIADFAMEVIGTSMTGAGILEGDYILFRKVETAQPGQIVAAVIETMGDPEATLKYFFNDNGKGPVLRPASPDSEDIILNGWFRIVGIMVGLIRKSAPSYQVYTDYLAARDINKEKWDPVIERAFQCGIKPEQVMAVIEMIRQVK